MSAADWSGLATWADGVVSMLGCCLPSMCGTWPRDSHF